MFCIVKVFIVKTVNSSFVPRAGPDQAGPDQDQDSDWDWAQGLLLAACLRATARIGKNIPLPNNYDIVITTK